ncbi:MAG: hypothetical protein RL154_550 [Pseudomonadota bacterium]|jgi:alpha-amylase/alpha-mannosidase (GH57 family)
MKQFLFGIHCHQPVDNFHNVVDIAIEKSYAPFLRVAKNFENFKFALHVSGWLLEFWKQNAPDMYADLKLMSARGQIEFFTGGFYEPILASIPSIDRIAQIKKLSNLIEQEFGQMPKGLWLTERVWECSIIPDLVECGIEYVVIDDYHFWAGGVNKTGGYYNTEEGGKEISLFPIQKKLRYALPFASPQESVNAVCEDDGVAIMFDDGEKFGLWPNTYEWVYEQKWLENFLTASSGRVEFVHFKDFKAHNLPLGVVYPPSCSYYEMGEWSLPTNDAIALHKIKEAVKDIAPDEVLAKSVRGGIWKNFLVKYPEAGHIHKRMLQMSKLSKELNSEPFNDALYRLQTNDCLWHGVFGGLYLPNLRDNAYKYLLECEELAYAKPELLLNDYNMDGLQEAKLQNSDLVLVFDANYGGTLSELGLKKNKFNYLNTLSRRKEAYHDKLVAFDENDSGNDGVSTIHKETLKVPQDVLEKLVFETFPRYSFMDFFSASEMIEASIAKPIEVNVHWQVVGDMAIEGSYSHERGCVKKRFELTDDGLRFDIEVTNATVRHYSCMMNFHLANYKDCDFNDKKLEERIFSIGIKELIIKDSVMGANLTVELDNPSNLIIYPIDTASQSEEGIDLTNQAVCCLFGMPIYNDTLKFGGILRLA